jgi:hypothetical protein
MKSSLQFCLFICPILEPVRPVPRGLVMINENSLSTTKTRERAALERDTLFLEQSKRGPNSRL